MNKVWFQPVIKHATQGLTAKFVGKKNACRTRRMHRRKCKALDDKLGIITTCLAAKLHELAYFHIVTHAIFVALPAAVLINDIEINGMWTL